MTEEAATPPSVSLLRQMAGDGAFQRGKLYATRGAVRPLRRMANGVQAEVEGTSRYRVRLTVEHDGVAHQCTCPVGEDGGFCKHCVAVGLVWIEQGVADDGVTVDVRAYLSNLDKSELVSMLLACAEEDEKLERRLTLRAAAAGPGTAAPTAWRGAFDQALAHGGYVDYREARDYAAGAEDVIEELRGLIDSGQAASVISLAEYGFAALVEASGSIDDSNGEIGALYHRLRGYHLEACRTARPDPAELADRLFELEMDTPFEIRPSDYMDVLAEPGFAAYRALVEAEWAKIRPLGPGDDDADHYGRRFRITRMMEEVARASGDVEALVGVKERDLSTPYQFLTIATLYRDAGHNVEALEWAERGWKAFSGSPRDGHLRTFLAEAYQEHGRHDEAMALAWIGFAELPHLAGYRQLESHARRAGRWEEWRDRALAHVRQQAASVSAAVADRRSFAWNEPTGRSLLVEIHLYEGDADAAWREAQAGGCTSRLWLRLAEAREQDHPDDAVGIYRGHIATLLQNTGGATYHEVVEFLGRTEALLDRSGDHEAFLDLLGEIRATHRRKRNLMALMNDRGW